MLELIDILSNQVIFTDQIKTVQSVRADVILGVLGKNCRGLGVCKIAPLHSTSGNCATKEARIARLSDDLISMRFEADQLCKCQLKRQFESRSFTVEQDFVLPDFVIRALHLQHRVIRRGSYRSGKTGGFCYVMLTLA